MWRGRFILSLLTPSRRRNVKRIPAAIGWIAAPLCFFLFAPSVSRGQEGVKLGLLMINADAGIFLAKERGYFQEQGISVELIFFSFFGRQHSVTLISVVMEA